MKLRTKRLEFFVLVVALAALPVAAQIPTSNLSGHVTAGKVVLPGVTLSASSPALQGTRVAVTSSSGDYVFPFLPPGEYTVTFELEGFRTAAATVRLSAAQTSRLDAELTAQFSDEIAVTGSQETISTSTTAATTYGLDLIEQLPVPRDLYNAVALAPGVHTTGLGGAITISGAQTNESLFLINGVVVNENYGGQALPLFIEDAIQETTTSVSGISADYGRFAGGVVNMLTKSGGNDFHGSLRANLDSQKWTATTPLTVAERSDAINTTYEATLGGFLWKDHVWFFAAARGLEISGSDQTAVTDIPYRTRFTETRYEGKLTISPTPNHRVVASYLDRTQSWFNGSQSPLPFVDAGDSIYDTSIPEKLEAAHYTGVLSDSFFLEGQWSQRTATILDYGSRFHDDPLQGGYQGTVVYDNTDGYTGNAAVFCGTCEPETRDNKDVLAKASWFLSTGSLGSHEVVVGVDRFQDLVFTMNHQSGSDWWFSATEFGFDGQDWWPVVYGDGSADLDWYPILEASRGINLTTDSAFLNDSWRVSDQLSFNLGVRWDANDGVNATGAQVSKDSRLSPRLGVTYSPGGDGDWVLNASYAHYVTALASPVANGSSPGGNPATFIWLYGGPDINTGAGPYLNPQQVLEQVFTWFTTDYCDAAGNCGTDNFDLLAIVDIPGHTRVIKGSLGSPYAEEVALGAAKRLGTRGLLRLDYTHREFKDLYETRVDLGTGQVELEALGVNWGSLDLGYIQNSSYSRRAYNGISLQGDYRVGDRLRLGGSYTWSHAYGNFDATLPAGLNFTSFNNPSYYPEYRDVSWSNPSGDLAMDQRHRARLWAVWDLLSTAHNRLSASILQSYGSGTPYSAIGAVFSRLYVANPGYLNPPYRVPYFYSGRGDYTTPATFPTDLSLNYSFVVRALGADLEIFVQPEVTNVFNQARPISVNTTVRDATFFSATFVSFNPWTTAPVECPQGAAAAECRSMGANWQKGPDFGKPTTPDQYQAPRTFRISAGVRF